MCGSGCTSGPRGGPRARQPRDVQELLLRTSLLDVVNGELADLLTGRPGSERVLLDLEDANSFVESLGSERAWFRYHHLLGDFLRPELRRALPADVPVLHRRAAGWYIQQGQLVHVRFLDSPVTGPSGEDIALGSDLRAVALMNLGTAEAWTLGRPDAERHLLEGAALARKIGRPYGWGTEPSSSPR